MTMDEFVVDLSHRLASCKSKQEALSILQEINSLTYASSGHPLSVEDKLKILENIRLRRGLISDSVEFSKEERKVYGATDNQELLNLINQMSQQLKGK